MNGASFAIGRQRSLASRRDFKINVAFAAVPMRAIEHMGIEQANRPRILDRGQIRAGANADIAAATFNERSNAITTVVAQRFAFAGTAAARADYHVILVE